MTIKDDAKMWSIAQLEGLRFLRAMFVTHAFSRHMHDYFVIGVIEDGLQTFTYRGAKHLTPPKGLIVLNPGEAHTGEAANSGGFQYRAFYPEVSLLQHIASEVSDRPQGIPFFTTPVIHDAPLVNAILRLHRDFEQPLSSLEYETRGYWLLGQLIMRHAEVHPQARTLGEERREVHRVRAYIDQHYDEDISLEKLASVANMSPFYFLRVFRKEVGLPPHGYLESVRIRQAQNRLAEGMPPAQVAVETGFYDQSHLTRSFKRAIGIPPGQYSNILQEPRLKLT